MSQSNPAAVLGDAERIREEADAILSDRVYDYGDQSRIDFDWSWLTDPIEDFFEWLNEMLNRAPQGTAEVFYIVLVTVAVALLVHIIYTLARSSRLRREPPAVVVEEQASVADELVERAGQLAQNGNYVDASRSLYEAALMMLEEKRRGRIRRGLTTNEYLRTFRSPWVVENLRVFVHLINWKWYRARDFDVSDYEQCRHAFENIRSRLQEEA